MHLTPNERDLLTLMAIKEDAAKATDGPMIYGTSSRSFSDTWMVFVNLHTARSMVAKGVLEVVDIGDPDNATSYRLTDLGRTHT